LLHRSTPLAQGGLCSLSLGRAGLPAGGNIPSGFHGRFFRRSDRAAKPVRGERRHQLVEGIASVVS